MQADILALVVLNVDRDFRLGDALIFRLGGDDVIGGAGRNPLREFPLVVGIKFPRRFLVIGATDPHTHPIRRTIARRIDRAKDKSIRLLGALVRPECR